MLDIRCFCGGEKNVEKISCVLSSFQFARTDSFSLSLNTTNVLPVMDEIQYGCQNKKEIPSPAFNLQKQRRQEQFIMPLC